MSSRSSSTASSTPAMMLAYLHHEDDKLFVRFPLAGSNSSGPSFARQAPSFRTSTAITSRSPAPRSLQGSGYSSSVGLTSRSIAYSSGQSVSTSFGAGRLREAPLVDLNHNGIWVPRPAPEEKKYECPFDRLDCSITFTQFERWFQHSLTHFKIYDPPSKNKCCFCDDTFEEKSGLASWKAKMEHTKTHHDRGEQLGTSRYDRELYRYLWKKKIITNVDFKYLDEEIKSTPTVGNVTSGNARAAPEGAGAYITVNNGRGGRRGGV